jgi:spermidine synthase
MEAALPYATVFLTSMGVMIVELAAGRLVSKYFGTSLYTWTTVIGVVLGGCSLGNFVGGRLADRHPSRELVAVLLIAASALVFAILALDPLVGRILAGSEGGAMTAGAVGQAVAAIALLFLLPSAGLGAVTPPLAKLVLQGSSRLGGAVGTVYALGSVGSIVGTFLSGFLLIPLLGVRGIVLGVSCLIGLLALLNAPRKLPAAVWLLLMAILSVFLLRGGQSAGTLYADYSAYSYIEVHDRAEEGTTERILVMDGLIHSRYDPSHPDTLLYGYERIFASLTALHAAPEGGLRTLGLGGGAFLFPVYLERHFPGSHEVVEIDPEVVRNARRFFDLPLDSTIRIWVADARSFVNRIQGQRSYDIVYLDAFNSYSVPAHLTTVEFATSVKALLAPGGVFVCNLIDIFSVGRFLDAYVRTVSAVFQEVAVYEEPGTGRGLRSTYVVACSVEAGLPETLTAHRGQGLVARRIPAADMAELHLRARSGLLTDDHAPVENLMAPVVLRSVR